MLNVEDGTSKADSDSYVSVSDADAYMSSRGYSEWGTLSDTEKEQAIRRATTYMLGEYRSRWVGYRATPTQALDWPRIKVVLRDVGPCEYRYPTNVVPPEVVNACIELSLKAAKGELLEDEEARVIESTIGPITTKYNPADTSRVKYLQVENMLKTFLSDGGSSFMVKLVRC